ncbi:NTP transferase domain-containing protein [Candidatus Roizmanbacteria bacterium]|nr:NTP transferase domain-containing protein [Candidatus Roizmanbacteria bacterium]
MKRDNIDVLILDAGRGRRLQPITNIFPKCLLTVQGTTVLERQIEQLSSFGLKRFTFCIGYKKKIIQQKLVCLSKKYNIKTFFKTNPHFSSTGTLFSLYLSLPKIKKNVILINGDIVMDINPIKELMEQIKRDKTTSIFIIKEGEADQEAVRVLLSKKGMIKKISKKIELEVCKGEFTGISYLSEKYVKQLKVLIPQLITNNRNEFYEYAVEKSIEIYGSRLKTILFKQARFIEIDTYKDYLRAKHIFDGNR